eukprot:CAMPEP_0173410222 /NCGR_PEP_ID=MMETSP1356-20130122/74117_1 /TAXON_ID=77927 ORGANISM="Hemiselmis virescens, Strain PCC157" /NCGR_SAMPLE_ID=MMETSP1356 /ASSEMBLY_ACC=CAM_ASM_000847 /LENGTH=34 /DNA_ID= /DNA_START= /DNA_END= /DNA_ORIENTATION=
MMVNVTTSTNQTFLEQRNDSYWNDTSSTRVNTSA